MKAWEEMIRRSDAARISPEAAELLIEKGGEGVRPTLAPAPAPPEEETGE